MAYEETWRPFPPLLQAALDSILPSDYMLGSRILKCFTDEANQIATQSRFFPPASTFRKLITLMLKEHSSNNCSFLFQVLIALKEYFCRIPGYGWERSPFALDDRLESVLHPFHLMGFDSSTCQCPSLRPFAFLKALIQALKENHCQLLELTQYFDSDSLEEGDFVDDEDSDAFSLQMANCGKQSWKDGICQILRYFLVVLEDPKACKAFYLDASPNNRIGEGKTCIFRYCLPYLVATLSNNDEKAASIILELCLQLSKKFNKEWDMAYIEELTRRMLVFHQPEPWRLFLCGISDLQLRMTVIEFVLKSTSPLHSFEISQLNVNSSQRYIPQLVKWIETIQVKENPDIHIDEEFELLFLFIYQLLDSFNVLVHL
ncbi:uncharacterized protein Gasu_08200 [Galdieria sulphuraria]|uniref:Uncharacterized protein n=1 Tax=Galdieria sulphuraria TaxID=130081 RepID=M2W879_GALSU|nr:uncharacterized protein Gasu_08200 [Galdieria sulphuraria]EME32076.1 hypothetical protein Gasu_08200 [Galdieria sulphuraria]|eukprot:XP_005708596.1 hypothetical protein Gasu_08200 [Galdieria sulphuraria]